MTLSKNEKMILRLYDVFSFSWPIQNKKFGFILRILCVLSWISAYATLIFINFFMWTSPIVNVITYINTYVFFLSGLALWITGYKYNNRLTLIFHKIANVDRELQMENINNNMSILHSILMWMLLILCAILSLFSNSITHVENNAIDYVFYVAQFISVCAGHSVFSVYVNIVKAIRIRYQFILENVIKLKHEFNAVKRRRQLIFLQSAHLNVGQIVQTINTYFGIPIMVIITAEFMQFLSAVYMISFGFKCIDLHVLFAEYKRNFQCLFILPSVVIIGYIAYICDITSNMVINY